MVKRTASKGLSPWLEGRGCSLARSGCAAHAEPVSWRACFQRCPAQRAPAEWGCSRRRLLGVEGEEEREGMNAMTAGRPSRLRCRYVWCWHYLQPCSQASSSQLAHLEQACVMQEWQVQRLGHRERQQRNAQQGSMVTSKAMCACHWESGDCQRGAWQP